MWKQLFLYFLFKNATKLYWVPTMRIASLRPRCEEDIVVTPKSFITATGTKYLKKVLGAFTERLARACGPQKREWMPRASDCLPASIPTAPFGETCGFQEGDSPAQLQMLNTWPGVANQGTSSSPAQRWAWRWPYALSWVSQSEDRAFSSEYWNQDSSGFVGCEGEAPGAAESYYVPMRVQMPSDEADCRRWMKRWKLTSP